MTTSRSTPYDVCVIGGGVAGAMVAYTLGRAGISTVILEAGPRHLAEDRAAYMERHLEGDDPWQSNLPARDVFRNVGEIHYPLNDYRVKGVGGSTLHWVGYTPRYHESDFEMRSRYGIADDWPVRYAELEPYYCEAEAEMGVAGDADNPFASWRSQPFPLPGFPIGYEEQMIAGAAAKHGVTFHCWPQARASIPYRGRSACVTYATCKTCPVRAKYSGDIHVERAEATGHVKVLADANVVRLETDGNRRVTRAIYATRDRVEHAVEARQFVLAAHAVESARLLLLSKTGSATDGLANSSGLVGRYFMEHRNLYRRIQSPVPVYPYRKGFATVYTEQFVDTPTRDSESGFLVRGYAAGDAPPFLAQQLIRRSGNWGAALERELVRRIESTVGRSLTIGTNAEPIPMESNRVELDDSLIDYFGNPAPRLSYSLTDYERAAFESGDKVILAMADSLGAERVEEPYFRYGGHHSGTCRMGNDPARSVVDRDLRTHDLENLHVVGSSTFVTISLVNPTLTIAAFSLRLGDHLVRRSRNA